MEPRIYVSIEAENFIVLCHRLLFGCSFFFNVVATLCLFKQAPEMQSEIKFYLYFMQVLIFLSDFILDIVIEPINLLPLLGGYCKGFACKWMSIKHSLIFTISILFLIAFCIFSCIFCRHQALISGKFKFRKCSNRAIRIAMLAILSSPVLYGLFTHFDDSESDNLIKTHGIEWMCDRGPSVIYKRTTNIALTLPLFILMVMLFSGMADIALLVHTMRQIYRGTLRSATSRKRIAKALLVLSLQLSLPMVLIFIPSTVFGMCIMDNEETMAFEVCYSCVFMVNTHSIFHSIVLLAITPAYRKFIRQFFLRITCREVKQEKRFSVHITAQKSMFY